MKLGKKQREIILLMRDGKLIYEKYATGPIYYMVGGKRIPPNLYESLLRMGLIQKLGKPSRHCQTYTISHSGQTIPL